MNTSLHGEVEQNLAQAASPMGAVSLLGNLKTDRQLFVNARIRRGRSFPPNEARMPQKQHQTSSDHSGTKVTEKVDTTQKGANSTKVTKPSPNFNSSIYDALRDSVESILAISTKFCLKSTKCRGVVLVCGSNDSPKAKKEGYATCILPLKTMMTCSMGRPLMLVDNTLIPTLGKYANHNLNHQGVAEASADHLPELILGLCCNNWGMYYGRNALIEAMLEVMGPTNRHKLSIHSALYATDFNTQAMAKILPQEGDHGMDDSEQRDRELHAKGYRESALKYKIGLDTIQNDRNRFKGVSKVDFVNELSKAVAQAVERTMANDGKSVIQLVLQILRHRRLIQENLTNKKFRRAPSQNGIALASRKLTSLFAENFSSPEEDVLKFAEQIPGWKEYAASLGGPARAILGLFCHSIDVLAGCIARYNQNQMHERSEDDSSNKENNNSRNSQPAVVEATPDLAERIVLTVLDSKDQRLMEYCFNQVYELMPTTTKAPARMYIYRRGADVSQFSTMPCGSVELGSNLKL